MIANILHPRSSNISFTPAQIQTVADSGIWLTDHLVLFLGGFLLLGGFVALRQLLSSGRSMVWAELGYVSAVISTCVFTVLMALDGITSKVVHNSWEDAVGTEKVIALRVAEMMEEIDVGIFSIYIIIFFGITFFLWGMAVAKGDVFPRWLGWVAVLLGVSAFFIGFAQAYTGLSVLVTNTLFATCSSLLILWVLIISFLSLRKGKQMG